MKDLEPTPPVALPADPPVTKATAAKPAKTKRVAKTKRATKPAAVGAKKLPHWSPTCTAKLFGKSECQCAHCSKARLN